MYATLRMHIQISLVYKPLRYGNLVANVLNGLSVKLYCVVILDCEKKRRCSSDSFVVLAGFLTTVTATVYCFALLYIERRVLVSSSRRRATLRQYEYARPTVFGSLGLIGSDWLPRTTTLRSRHDIRR